MLKTISDIKITDKPLIINGWGKVKTLYPSQKITNKKISENLFWTFSEKEKNTEHKKDMENFKKYCFENFEKQYSFYFLNPFELNYSQVKKLILKIKEMGRGVIFYDKKHFFIYVNNIIFCLNEDFLELTTITTKKIKNWFKRSNFELFEDIDIFNISEIDLNNKEYLILPIKQKIEYEKEFIVGYIFE